MNKLYIDPLEPWLESLQIGIEPGDLGHGAYQALRPLARWSDAWASTLGEDGEQPNP